MNSPMQNVSTPLLIKICGITHIEDAMAAVDAGANWLGLIFVESSPRSITLENALALVPAIRKHAESLSKDIKIVGVFQDQDTAHVMAIAQKLELDYIQLHGEESLETCSAMPCRVIKTIVIRPELQEADILAEIQRYQPSDTSNIATLLLDIPKQKDAVSMAVRPLPASVATALKSIPHFLAGGFNPDNIQQVLSHYQPNGVDVASGVEASPGRKCPEKMRAFYQAVQQGFIRFSNSSLIGDSPRCNP